MSLANLFVKYWFHLIKTEKRKITFHLIVVVVDFGSHSLDMFFIKKYSKVSELFWEQFSMCHYLITVFLVKYHIRNNTSSNIFSTEMFLRYLSRPTIPILWIIINLNSIGKLMIEMKRLEDRKFGVELSVPIW